MRTIKVVTTLSGAFTLVSDAETLSELMSESDFRININSDNMRFRVRGQDIDLDSSSILPEEDFVLFASPRKNKSGK